MQSPSDSPGSVVMPSQAVIDGSFLTEPTIGVIRELVGMRFMINRRVFLPS